MDLRLRTAVAVLPTLLCLACGAGVSREGRVDTPVVSRLPSTTTRPGFAAPSSEVRSLATPFVRAVFQYDATADSRLAFLANVERLVTSDELTRLATSSRAHLPWAVLKSRQERTEVEVYGVSEQLSRSSGERVFVWVCITTRTSFAMVRELKLVSLTLVSDHSGSKVEQARGAGL